MKVEVAFFSGTGVTRTIAGKVHAALVSAGADARLRDVTALGDRRGAGAADAFIFGYPVFADLPPGPMAAYLAGLEGRGRPCAVFATYGGRTAGYALYHGYRLLSGAGFKVCCAAEFLGRHTFNAAGWDLLAHRPDGRDFAVAGRFAALALDRFAAGGGDFSLQKPFGYDRALGELAARGPRTERTWAQPVRTKECSRCGACERGCPTGAMDAAKGESDIRSCIECLRCQASCPEGALACDPLLTAHFPTFLRDFNFTAAIADRKESRCIAASWEGVS